MSDALTVFKLMFYWFGNKPFLKLSAQRLQSLIVYNGYGEKGAFFTKTVHALPIYDIPDSANIIVSHNIYKINQSDDGSLALNDRIDPHGIEEDQRSHMRSDCAMCSPLGVRALLSTTSALGWQVGKIDMKAAFLLTGHDQRGVFAVPPRESSYRGKVCGFCCGELDVFP